MPRSRGGWEVGVGKCSFPEPPGSSTAHLVEEEGVCCAGSFPGAFCTLFLHAQTPAASCFGTARTASCEKLFLCWLVGHPSHVGNNFLRSVVSVRDL